MAEEVYSELIDFSILDSGLNPTPQHADWTSLKPQAEKFMRFQPNVYWQGVKEGFATFYVQNATLDGYNAKIHHLDTGYNINEAIYGNTGNYARVVGQRPSKTLAGATRGVSFLPIAVQIVFGQFLGIQ